MSISWGTLKSLLLFFGPMLLPKAIGVYRNLKKDADDRALQSRQNRPAAPVLHPLPRRSVFMLSLLAITAVMWLMSAGLVLPASVSRTLHLPKALCMPENIFVATDSRLQTPNDVIFTRLAAQRPGRELTFSDEALRSRLLSLESRLLYLQLGPDALTECPFCSGTGIDAQSSYSATNYLHYALIDLVAAHLFNLVLIAAATSPLLLLGRKSKSLSAAVQTHPNTAETLAAHDYGSQLTADHAHAVAVSHIRRWRTSMSVLALCGAALDVYLVATYDNQVNARATRLVDLDLFFWTMRTYRGLACGGSLAALAAVLYLVASGHHRSARLGLLGALIFGSLPPPSPAARITAVVNGLNGVKGKLNAGAIVKNTALRDTDLRAHTQSYWAHEVMLVAEAMKDHEVVEGVNNALENRIDMQRIARDAEQYAQTVVPTLLATQPILSQQQQRQQP
ncbi:hypothetical protein SEPCBS119000_006410 [Sporothrix epigloea]|uniref:Uncharacterized protein n=1 Tax=Sporothrix epigloea TaxID=1892477 RepID=A0ABP0E2V3_9PEZI